MIAVWLLVLQKYPELNSSLGKHPETRTSRRCPRLLNNLWVWIGMTYLDCGERGDSSFKFIVRTLNNCKKIQDIKTQWWAWCLMSGISVDIWRDQTLSFSLMSCLTNLGRSRWYSVGALPWNDQRDSHIVLSARFCDNKRLTFCIIFSTFLIVIFTAYWLPF